MMILGAIYLSAGSHTSPEEGMCIMEAVSRLAGEPFSSTPECASRTITRFLLKYNDALKDEDRQTLVRYIPRLIGTRGSAALEERRAFMALDWLIRVCAPAWLRFGGFDAEAAALEALPEIASRAQVASVEAPLAAAQAATKKAIADFDAAFSSWDDGYAAIRALHESGGYAANLAACARREMEWVGHTARTAHVAARRAAAMGLFQGGRENPTPYLQQTVHALLERMIAAQES